MRPVSYLSVFKDSIKGDTLQSVITLFSKEHLNRTYYIDHDCFLIRGNKALLTEENDLSASRLYGNGLYFYYDVVNNKWYAFYLYVNSESLYKDRNAECDWSLEGYLLDMPLYDIAELYNKYYIERFNINFIQDYSYWIENTFFKEVLSRDTNKYLYELHEKYGVHCLALLMFPEIELLVKANYKIYHIFSNIEFFKPKVVSILVQLFKEGSSINSIFKVHSYVYKMLKECDDLDTWAFYMNLDNRGVSKEIIKEIYDLSNIGSFMYTGFYDSFLYLLDYKYNNTKLFTIRRLVNYIVKVKNKTHKSIDATCMYVKDYFNMCKDMGITPSLNIQYLKVEHDRLSKMYAKKLLEMQNLRCSEAYDFLSKYSYSNEKYFVRPIKDSRDIANEGSQQDNCVASYWKDHIKGKVSIFVMRRVSDPDKSLITIDLDYINARCRQSYLAHNRKITDFDQLLFIKEWLDFVRTQNLNAA